MFLQEPPRSDAVGQLYRASAAAQGFVMNLTRLWAWRPELSEAFAALRSQLMAGSSLGRRDWAVLVCATASQAGDSYCSLAWGRTLASEAGAPVAAAVLQGQTAAEGLQPRDRALASWARKVVSGPSGTVAADVEALAACGFGEREIFEITAFIALRQAFSCINAALGAVPDRQLVEQAPELVVQAVSYGRQPAPQASVAEAPA